MNHAPEPFGSHCSVILGVDGRPLLSCPSGWNGLVIERREVPSSAQCGPQFTGVPVIVVALSGRGKRWARYNGRIHEYRSSPPDINIFGKTFERDSGRWDGEPGESISLRFPENVLQRYLQDEAEGFDLRTSYGNLDDTLRRCVISLAEEMQHGLPTGRLYAEGLSMQIIAWLVNHYVHSAKKVSTRTRGGLSTAQKVKINGLIEQYLTSDLTLERLAEEIGVGAFHFIRLFRATFGQTPHQYLVARRIELAKDLLSKKARLSIAEIALQSGFSSQAHFSYAFRKICGDSPLRWRNRS